MEIKSTITLDDKQFSAISKRVVEGMTVEDLCASIVADQAQRWANDDYSTLSAMLVSKLKDQPQAVLDTIIGQIAAIAPIVVEEEPVISPVVDPVVIEDAEPI